MSNNCLLSFIAGVHSLVLLSLCQLRLNSVIRSCHPRVLIPAQVVTLSKTAYPTQGPTITLVPSTTTLTTFAGLQSSLNEVATQEVQGAILFDYRLDLFSKKRRIVGINNATFNGGTTTSFFLLLNTSLTLEDITLEYGRSTSSGGCARAQASTLVLIHVVVTNCAAVADGGAFLLYTSVLHANQSVFDSNAAAGGAVAYIAVRAQPFL